MRQYNIEIFDNEFTFKDNTAVGSVSYEEDYLSIEENSLSVMSDSSVEQTDYIRIMRGTTEDSLWVVSGVQQGEGTEKEITTIKFKPLISLFSQQIVFDTDLQGSDTTLEQAIADIINNYFISNSDTSMNISGLTVETTSETSSWGFHLTSSAEGQSSCICNFYESILVPALTKYQVVVNIVPDFASNALTAYVGVNESSAVYIEADLSNVYKKTINILQGSEDANKLIVYDSTDFTNSVEYFLHTDYSYDTTDDDRLLPVIQSIQTAEATDTQTFAEAAASVAANTFSNKTYNNLIELEVLRDDSLINPLDLDFGQIVNVISEGNTYESMLTGRSVGDTVTLIFGSIRLDLTKILGGR